MRTQVSRTWDAWKGWQPSGLASCEFWPLRKDKYDGKPIYWVEEEIEVEYSKTASRSQTESSSYQVAGSLADAMADASEGVSLNMQAVAGGKLTGFSPRVQKSPWVSFDLPVAHGHADGSKKIRVIQSFDFDL